MKNLKFILYNFIIVFFSLCALEGVCSYLLNHPKKIPNLLLASFKSYYKIHDRLTIQVIPACASYNANLFYLLNPGLCQFSNREFSTIVKINKKGFRDDEESFNYPEIITLGDSFTMGWGVEQDSSFSEILQRVSSKKVANLGISSFGTAREFTALNQVKLDSVKTIIIQYHPNDLQENKSFIINDQLKISGKSVYDSIVDAQMHSRDYYPGKYISLILKEKLKEYIYNKPLEETDREEAELFVKVTEAFANKFSGKEVIIFEINSSNENDSFFSNHLKSQFDKYWGENPEFELKILDVSNMVSDSDYFILDDHLNSEGHKKLAKLLIEHINK